MIIYYVKTLLNNENMKSHHITILIRVLVSVFVKNINIMSLSNTN